MSDDQSLEGTWARLSQVVVKGAQYNSPERHPHPKCLEGTRVDLLKYIHGFLDDPKKNQLIWLHGTAGVGKSAVAFTVAERMRGLKVVEETNVEKRLAGTFFFSRKHTKRSTTGYFFATLAYQLATNFPSIRKDVNRVIRDNPALLDPDTPLCDQMEALFLKPLRWLRSRLSDCLPLTFVIDALDECTSEPELIDLILSLARALREPDTPVTHVLLTSRSEPHICKAFHSAEVLPLLCEIPVKTFGEGVATIISLDGADVDKDIYIFLQHSFAELASRHTDFPQLSRDDLAKLASRAGRRFIVASTMMKFIIDDEDEDPHDRLQLMLKLTSELLPGTEVYKLYDCILSTCADPKRAYMHLSIVAALADPLPISQISSLLGPGLGRDVETTLIQLRSVMDIPTDSTLPVNIHHSSIRDYVSDSSNCSLPQVREHDMQSPHFLLADSSLRLMMKNIPESTALLDALSELQKHSQAMQPQDPQILKNSLTFLVQPPKPLSVLTSMLWLRGDRSSDLRFWLETLDGRGWLQTRGGDDWLHTQEGRDWLQTQGGRGWLQTTHGQEWFQTLRRRYWLRIQGGRDWLQTRGGQDALQTHGGQAWLETEAGRDWLETPAGRNWLQTKGVRYRLQTKGGRDWLRTQGGDDWLWTHDGRDWLQTQGARQWLQTPTGQEWLQTQKGNLWLKTQGGNLWLQTQGGKLWLQTHGGEAWLKTEQGKAQPWGDQPHTTSTGGSPSASTVVQVHSQIRYLSRIWKGDDPPGGQEWLQTREGLEWFRTQRGREWPQTEGGREWFQTQEGRAWLQTQGALDWLQTQGGRDWLQTREVQEWLQMQGGRDWLQTQGGHKWLQMQGGRAWLQTQGALDWLQTREVQEWLQTQRGRDWLQTPLGRDWLQTPLGRDWLQTPHGKAWQSTPAASVWVILEEFASTLEAISKYTIVGELLLLPAFQVVQRFKSLPDFLMFPTFVALMHQDHFSSTLPDDFFPPDRKIIHAMNTFTTFANEAQQQSRSSSDALKYACQNWAVHLSRAPNPWDGKLSHRFQAFWNRHLLAWLERQWCSKGLRSCLNILSEGQKFTKVCAF